MASSILPTLMVQASRDVQLLFSREMRATSSEKDWKVASNVCSSTLYPRLVSSFRTVLRMR